MLARTVVVIRENLQNKSESIIGAHGTIARS
jgi:hypothetical protein